jgi:diguanylate cyclase (GGDEF)-like protein/PAS domain S-box-containing protein
VTTPAGPQPFDPDALSSDLRRALADLHREQAFLHALLENLGEGIIACDAEGRITLLNAAGRRLCGIPEGADSSSFLVTDVPLRDAHGTLLGAGEHPLARALAGERVHGSELVVRDVRGVERILIWNAQPLFDGEGAKLGAVVVLQDVSEQRRTEARLAELALRDPLTGVANRLLLADRLRHALDRMHRTGGSVALLLLDLDDFKSVNDRFGHDVGDAVLIATAERLTRAVRPEDTVARLGGDEFVVVCEVSGDRSELEVISRRVNDVLSEPYRVGRRVLMAEASVGAVLATRKGDDPAALLAHADAEMYRVKARRRQVRQRRSSRPA